MGVCNEREDVRAVGVVEGRVMGEDDDEVGGEGGGVHRQAIQGRCDAHLYTADAKS